MSQPQPQEQLKDEAQAFHYDEFLTSEQRLDLIADLLLQIVSNDHSK